MDLAEAEAPEDKLMQHDDLIGEPISPAEEAAVQDTVMRAIYQVIRASGCVQNASRRHTLSTKLPSHAVCMAWAPACAGGGCSKSATVPGLPAGLIGASKLGSAHVPTILGDLEGRRHALHAVCVHLGCIHHRPCIPCAPHADALYQPQLKQEVRVRCLCL